MRKIGCGYSAITSESEKWRRVGRPILSYRLERSRKQGRGIVSGSDGNEGNKTRLRGAIVFVVPTISNKKSRILCMSLFFLNCNCFVQLYVPYSPLFIVFGIPFIFLIRTTFRIVTVRNNIKIFLIQSSSPKCRRRSLPKNQTPI